MAYSTAGWCFINSSALPQTLFTGVVTLLFRVRVNNLTLPLLITNPVYRTCMSYISRNTAWTPHTILTK